MSSGCCRTGGLTAPASGASRLAALCLLLLQGCALFPLSEAECQADARERGYSDGFMGQHAQDLRLVPECRERYAIDVDREQYLAGWREGYDEWYRIQGSVRRDRD